MSSIAAIACAGALFGADTVFDLLPDGALFHFPGSPTVVLRKDTSHWYRLRMGGRRYTTGAGSAVITVKED